MSGWPPRRADVEDFLFTEAALLDAWRLDEWLALFTDDAVYQVPFAGAPDDARPETSLFYIADDRFRLGHRVKRLNSPEAHSEFPRSKCVRMIGNVRIVAASEREIGVGSTFVTYRSKNGITDVYPGRHSYRLSASDDGWRIAFKRSTLALDNLRPQGRVSIIL